MWAYETAENMSVFKRGQKTGARYKDGLFYSRGSPGVWYKDIFDVTAVFHPKREFSGRVFCYKAKFRLMNYVRATRNRYGVCPFCLTAIFHGSGQEGWQEGQERQERRQGDWKIWDGSHSWTDDQWYEIGAIALMYFLDAGCLWLNPSRWNHVWKWYAHMFKRDHQQKSAIFLWINW